MLRCFEINCTVRVRLKDPGLRSQVSGEDSPDPGPEVPLILTVIIGTSGAQRCVIVFGNYAGNLLPVADRWEGVIGKDVLKVVLTPVTPDDRNASPLQGLADAEGIGIDVTLRAGKVFRPLIDLDALLLGECGRAVPGLRRMNKG